ncbi:protein FAR1-RELATED SEQUENCE 5-like [Chenopodium quinoa]|uniref:protein FAR1-RELATED SEQUENCE 5-like n=1 Tax=Chenopodium quinoa TaxID=63459 RepID=UPI000B77FE31|nr:protein FAR1-RELATED SEQUENCE 5-like [Chenopodium quinoa]
MEEEFEQLPDSQESIEMEQIEDSLMNLEIETNNQVLDLEDEHRYKQIEHLHRSERKITEEKAKAIDLMADSGLRPADAFRLISSEAGGEELVGHTITDHYNYISRKKIKEIQGGDAQTVIDRLYKRQSEDDDFFFRFKLGDGENENKLTAIFWRDSEMKEDFQIYGDVVVFDTTYRTNKYNLICAPIVGLNNHWLNVVFGCAFIADEKIETFEWVLDTFKKSMGGSEPASIFTDQDLEMSKAIETVLPHSRHRLCIWHLIKNVVSRFGALKRDTSFKDAFNKCLSGCVTEEEFQKCWDSMIAKYKLENNKWFKRLYGLREKWCTALSKDFFSAGILSSQRSESANNAVGFKANKNTSLTDFFKIFNQTVKRWRKNESDADFKCSNSNPTSSIPFIGLLKHASEVYTQTIFRYFETEFMYSIGCITYLHATVRDFYFYEVQIEYDDSSRQKVTYNKAENKIACSCKNFEEIGWLCYHCIKILHHHNVTRIPSLYISTRWSKMAKAHVWKKKDEDGAEKESQSDKLMPWRHTMARRSYNLLIKCQDHKETRNLVEEHFKMIQEKADEFKREWQKNKEKENSSDQQEATSNQQQTSADHQEASPELDIPAVIDPEKANTKGRSKRIKGHFEKGKQPKAKKTKAMQAKGNAREFGTLTPIQNPKLF